MSSAKFGHTAIWSQVTSPKTESLSVIDVSCSAGCGFWFESCREACAASAAPCLVCCASSCFVPICARGPRSTSRVSFPSRPRSCAAGAGHIRPLPSVVAAEGVALLRRTEPLQLRAAPLRLLATVLTAAPRRAAQQHAQTKRTRPGDGDAQHRLSRAARCADGAPGALHLLAPACVPCAASPRGRVKQGRGRVASARCFCQQPGRDRLTVHMTRLVRS